MGIVNTSIVMYTLYSFRHHIWASITLTQYLYKTLKFMNKTWWNKKKEEETGFTEIKDTEDDN